MVNLRRREFITLLGGAAVGWPLAARAEQAGEHMRRVGVLMSVANGSEGQARLAAFLNACGKRAGSRVAMCGLTSVGAPEIPSVLANTRRSWSQASGDHSVVASQQATRTVPIVFTVVSDPVGTGYVASLARPGGNMTGFTLFEYSTSAKYLEV